MQIIPLSSLIKNVNATGVKSAAGTGSGAITSSNINGDSFTNIFSDAVNNLKQTEAVAETENEKLLTGETDDIHTAMIAAQKAEVAVNLAVTIRDKVITAYNEVMNMQV